MAPSPWATGAALPDTAFWTACATLLAVVGEQPFLSLPCYLHSSVRQWASSPDPLCHWCNPTRANRYMQVTQGIPLEHQAQVTREDCVSGPKGSETIERESSDRQTRTRVKLNDRVHVLHRGTFSKQVGITVSQYIETNIKSQNEEIGTCSEWRNRIKP